MIFGSVCSGIEAASVAFAPLGWRAAFLSEIGAFPSAVLAHRFPDVPNLGDMTRFQDWPDANIDVLCGGTPCQSFSVAGLREGLGDPRGDLMLTFGAIARRYRPRWLLWENVPGVLSSNGGRDFGAFLRLLAACGYGFAYRVLDAQFAGLAQRRERVFVVGCLGDWRAPAAVLLDASSLRGDLAPSREKGQGVAASLTRGADSSGKGGYAGRRREDDVNLAIAHALTGTGFDASEDGTGRGTPLVARALTTSNQRIDAETETLLAFDARQSDTIQYGDKSGPLDTDGHTIGIQAGSNVRRLTPRECERLQGFPDDWTLIPYRGKPAKDGPRYQAIGNSWAVPCVRWIGERIAMVDQIAERLAA